MVAGHEADVATYLTADGQVFLAPQYNIAFDQELNEGGSCRGDQEDIDLIVASGSDVILVEAKGHLSWDNLQLAQQTPTAGNPMLSSDWNCEGKRRDSSRQTAPCSLARVGADDGRILLDANGSDWRAYSNWPMR